MAAVAAEHGRGGGGAPGRDRLARDRAGGGGGGGGPGGLDVLVANAGVNVPRRPWTSPRPIGTACWMLTSKGSSSAARPGGGWWRKGEGSIVTIASQNGVIGYPYRARTARAKAGVVNPTRVLALEWAARGCGSTPWGPPSWRPPDPGHARRSGAAGGHLGASPWAGWGRRRRWPTPCSSWPARRPPSSPAPASWPTGAGRPSSSPRGIPRPPAAATSVTGSV